jgi:hypothetical protein
MVYEYLARSCVGSDRGDIIVSGQRMTKTHRYNRGFLVGYLEISEVNLFGKSPKGMQEALQYRAAEFGPNPVRFTVLEDEAKVAAANVFGLQHSGGQRLLQLLWRMAQQLFNRSVALEPGGEGRIPVEVVFQTFHRVAVGVHIHLAKRPDPG